MKTIPKLPCLAPVFAAVLTLAGLPLRAETFSGPITLTGEVQNEAKPGSISFTYKGQLKGRDSGEKVNVSGGGLFRSIDNNIVNTTFTGRLTAFRRFSTTISGSGRFTRSNTQTRVVVTKRTVRFPGGTITLQRPINGTIDTVQKISGRGTLTFQR